jgi:diacylglycerol O-acyltransferase-1
MNLGILILILNHVRLIVENFLKYGLLIKDVKQHRLIQFPFFATLPQYRESPIFFALLVMLAIAMVAYGIQKL